MRELAPVGFKASWSCYVKEGQNFPPEYPQHALQCKGKGMCADWKGCLHASNTQHESYRWKNPCSWQQAVQLIQQQQVVGVVFTARERHEHHRKHQRGDRGVRIGTRTKAASGRRSLSPFIFALTGLGSRLDQFKTQG